MGIAEALGAIILGWHKQGQLQGWLRLLFSISFSFSLGFNCASGTVLVASGTGLHALGAGLLSGSAMALVAYQSASKDITKGTVVAVPQEIVDAEFDKESRGPMVTQPKQ